MTCDTMLQRMLDAAPETLAGHGDDELAVHLRECGRCRAVAAVLLRETRAMASALDLPVRPRRTVRRRLLRMLLAPQAAMIAVAAGIIIYASRLAVRVEPVRVAAVSATIASSPATTIDSPAVPPIRASRPRRAPRVSAPALGARLAPPMPIVPTAIVAAPIVASARPVAQHGPAATQSDALDAQRQPAPGVLVDPPRGVRAAVLRTSDPKITVVWLY